MRASACVLLLGFFAACGGNSQRQNGGNGSGGSGAQAAVGGNGGDSVSMTGGTSGTTATGGSGGSGTSTGGSGATSGASSGGTDNTGGTGGATGNGGSGASSSGGDGARAGASAASGGTGGASGGTGGSAAMGGAAGAPPEPPVPITSCTDDFPFLGTWDGTVLDFFFEPLEELKLDLFEEEDEIVGELTWGSEGEPLPPVESADVPWPPGYWDRNDMDIFGSQPEPWPGFAYTVVRGAGCDSTFRFSISTAEIWQEWCALQQPVYTAGSGWACTLQGGGSSDGTSCTVQPEGMAWETYPLWKCNACGAFGFGRVCECDEDGCFASNEATHTFNLAYSASAEAEILSGPDPSCGDCTVRLERQP